MRVADQPWYPLLAAAIAMVAVVVFSLVLDRDVSWFGVVVIGVAAGAGAYVGRRIRSRRSE